MTRHRHLGAGAVLALAVPVLTAAAAQADSRYVVTYEGSGAYHTTFKAHPPNDGGADDHNSAKDSSRQSWAIKFEHGIAIPTCGPPAGGGTDPCAAITGLTGARGPTVLTGRVDHQHVDGLFRQLDSAVKCRLRASTKRRRLDVELSVRYLPDSQSFAVRALDPLATTVTLFGGQCPQMPDGIDRMFDFYAMPGFSFADGYGPDRWFTSREVIVPAAAFERSKRMRIKLGNTLAGRSPRHCAVRDPSFERCRTGGWWNGVLTFTPRRSAAASAKASAVRVHRPKNGDFKGDGGRFFMKLSKGSIEVVEFDFKCKRGATTGRTGLNDVPIKKQRGRYRFSIKAHGGVGYADDQQPENAAISISGRFTPSGRRAVGVLRVNSPRCGSTGDVNWSATH